MFQHHGIFKFQESDGSYYLTDYGSRNGTYVNKQRLSSAKQESEPCEIPHGTIITLGSTDLLCHIHPGRETCEECEPGVVAAKKCKVFKEYILKVYFIISRKNHKELLSTFQRKNMRHQFHVLIQESLSLINVCKSCVDCGRDLVLKAMTVRENWHLAMKIGLKSEESLLVLKTHMPKPKWPQPQSEP